MNTYLADYNVMVCEFETQKELTLTFGRLQEFYESPYQWIRGKYFTLETFLETHMSDNGDLTYYNDWSGFNVPSKIVREFYKVFDYNLTTHEWRLAQYINTTFTEPGADYYLIGIVEGDTETLEHELVHAKYHNDETYRNNAYTIVAALPSAVYNALYTGLTEMGYCNTVIIDEINAYLTTDSLRDLQERWDLSPEVMKELKPTRNKLRKLWKNAKENDDAR